MTETEASWTSQLGSPSLIVRAVYVNINMRERRGGRPAGSPSLTDSAAYGLCESKAAWKSRWTCWAPRPGLRRQ